MFNIYAGDVTQIVNRFDCCGMRTKLDSVNDLCQHVRRFKVIDTGIGGEGGGDSRSRESAQFLDASKNPLGREDTDSRSRESAQFLDASKNSLGREETSSSIGHIVFPPYEYVYIYMYICICVYVRETHVESDVCCFWKIQAIWIFCFFEARSQAFDEMPVAHAGL